MGKTKYWNVFNLFITFARLLIIGWVVWIIASWKWKITAFILTCLWGSCEHAQCRRDPTGCRCLVLLIRCNPMIMSDYDTLALTYRDTTMAPVIQETTRNIPTASCQPLWIYSRSQCLKTMLDHFIASWLHQKKVGREKKQLILWVYFGKQLEVISFRPKYLAHSKKA